MFEHDLQPAISVAELSISKENVYCNNEDNDILKSVTGYFIFNGL